MIIRITFLILFVSFSCNNSPATTQSKAPHPSSSTIKIASWNIENFGVTKANDPERMKIISNILKNYDIIAIQEISNVKEMSDKGCTRNENACPGDPNCNAIRNSLEKHLNQELGLKYSFSFSSQVKDERYLFVYNSKVQLIEASLMNDPDDSLPICDSSPSNTGKMVRQPYKGKFKAGSFDFMLLTAHTSPSINIQELQGLEWFYKQPESTTGEKDIIVLGDLNADCSYLKASDSISFKAPGYIWLIPDSADTTVSNTDCAYDRIIFKSPTSEDYTGNYGIFKDIPENVSDHYLIWAEFYTDKDSD